MPNPFYNGLTNQVLKPTGAFTGGSFTNLSGCTIDLTAATFSGMVTFGSLKNCNIKGGKWANVSGISCLWTGSSSNVTVSGRSFTSCGSADELSDSAKQMPYDGTDSSLVWFNISFDSDTLTDTGMYCQGSFAKGSQGLGFTDSVSWSNFTISNTRSNGTQVRGVFFRYKVNNGLITYTKNNGVNPVLGDVGAWYTEGCGNINGLIVRGGRGYIVRNWQYNRKNLSGVIASDTIVTNCVKSGTNTYGLADTRAGDQDGTWAVRAGNYHVENNTQYNCTDSIGYWTGIAIIGGLNMAQGNMRVFVKNNLAANIQSSQNKSPIADDQSNGTWNPADATGNQYFDVVAGHIEPATGKNIDPTYPTIGAQVQGGTTTPPSGGGTTTPPGGGTTTPPATAKKVVSVSTKTSYLVTYSDGTTDTF